MYADDIRKELKEEGYAPDFIARMTANGLIAKMAEANRKGDKTTSNDLLKELNDNYEDYKKTMGI